MAVSRQRRRRHETRSSGGENRLWPALAVVVAALAYSVLPEGLLVGPRLAIPVVELVLLGALLVTNPRRLVRQTRWSRGISITLACLVIATNLVALAMLVRALTSGKPDGMPLLLAGMQVWLTNVIGFGLLFWELDRGGPVARHTVARDRMPPADWRFSQDENQDAVSRSPRPRASAATGGPSSSTTSTCR